MQKYLQRLGTYDESWGLLDPALDPYLLAAHGFAFESGQLACCGCGLRLPYQSLFAEDDPSDSAKATVQAMKHGHFPECTFKQQILMNCLSYYDRNLESFSGSVPSLDWTKLKGKLSLFKPVARGDGYDAGKVLAAMGWRAAGDSLCCELCNARLQVEQDGEPVQVVREGGFDPLSSHRYFCLWGGVSEDSDELYGWQFCLIQLRKRQRCGSGTFDEVARKSEKLAMHLNKLREIGERNVAKVERIRSLVGLEPELAEELGRQRALVEELQRELGLQPRKLVK